MEAGSESAVRRKLPGRQTFFSHDFSNSFGARIYLMNFVGQNEMDGKMKWPKQKFLLCNSSGERNS